MLPLETWASRRYPVRTPHITTLRKWARDGKIQPPPRKHGRSYFVQADAQYMNDAMMIEAIHVAAQT